MLMQYGSYYMVWILSLFIPIKQLSRFKNILFWNLGILFLNRPGKFGILINFWKNSVNMFLPIKHN